MSFKMVENFNMVENFKTAKNFKMVENYKNGLELQDSGNFNLDSGDL